MIILIIESSDNMNKKAFTLVELIGVLVILSVLVLVAVPSVLKIIKNTKQKTYDSNITMIKTAMPQPTTVWMHRR